MQFLFYQRFGENVKTAVNDPKIYTFVDALTNTLTFNAAEVNGAWSDYGPCPKVVAVEFKPGLATILQAVTNV